MSALLFIIVAEILAIKIRTSPNINGIRVPYNSEIAHIKISQLADNTTLFLQNADEISYVLEIIDKFGTFSGLKLNKNKTEGLWIGKLKQNKHNVCDINFTNKCVKALGIYFGNHRKTCLALNLNDRIDYCQRLLKNGN